jgi:CubicO group peptidase (beta-lactamase class C family)
MELPMSHTTRSFARRCLPFLAPCVPLVVSGCALSQWNYALQVSTGFASHVLCDDVLVTGVDPETAFAERVQALPAMAVVGHALRYRVDAERAEVEVSLAGFKTSRARLRPGLGCIALPAKEEIPAAGSVGTDQGAAPSLPRVANQRLDAVLARALSDRPDERPHRIKALLVVKDGQVVAERYAHGYGPQTPVLGFSMSKSVINALVGILVQKGRLRLDQPAPIDAWQTAGDPRRVITIEHLLRQTSGLALPQDNSGRDINSQILYSGRDKAALAAAVPMVAAPGTRWNYSDGNYMLLSRIVRDAVGGSANDVLRFARSELFTPLGICHVVMDFDATDTPVGSSHFMASAEDWARFGQLFLDDGVAGGTRLLPEGWVHMSSSPTLDTGYGAGFWTNHVDGLVPHWREAWGLPRAPRETFFARGFMGQYLVIVPSERLLLVRLSVNAANGSDIGETDRILAEVREELNASRVTLR